MPKELHSFFWYGVCIIGRLDVSIVGVQSEHSAQIKFEIFTEQIE